MFLTRPPLPLETQRAFDLHVLGTPPAFILSQDQTRHSMFYFTHRILRWGHVHCLARSKLGKKFAWLVRRCPSCVYKRVSIDRNCCKSLRCACAFQFQFCFPLFSCSGSFGAETRSLVFSLTVSSRVCLEYSIVFVLSRGFSTTFCRVSKTHPLC